MNEIIKTADVCRKFCISKRTATRWIRTQGFPAPRKIGKAFFFDADENALRFLVADESTIEILKSKIRKRNLLIANLRKENAEYVQLNIRVLADKYKLQQEIQRMIAKA